MVSEGGVDGGGSMDCRDGYSGQCTNNPAPLVDEGLVASSSLERATLTCHTARKLQAHYSAAVGATKPSNSSSAIFWMLVAVLLVLALSNLALTFFAMGVLRLGAGMESIEFITGESPMLRLFGLADLGLVQQQDGVLSTYSGEQLTIIGDHSQVSLGVNTVRPSPTVHVAQHTIHLANVDNFQVLHPVSGASVFSSRHPEFAVPRCVRGLRVQRARTARLVSPTDSDLGIRADSTIRVKGNEGVTISGRSIEWNADRDIFLRSLNGSLVLDGGEGGIFVEVNNLPLAGPPTIGSSGSAGSRDRGQYKLCVCHKPPAGGGKGGRARRGHAAGAKVGENGARSARPTLAEGHLFRVPVPLDNMRRSREHQIHCGSFTNPCMMM